MTPTTTTPMPMPMPTPMPMPMPIPALRGVRVYRVMPDGRLMSPVWQTIVTAPVIRADAWNDDDAIELTPGIHALRHPGRIPAPEDPDIAVAEVSVIPGARARVGQNAWRAEAVIIDSLTLHPNCPHADAVRARWARHCTVRVARRNAALTIDMFAATTHTTRRGKRKTKTITYPDGTRFVQHWRNGSPHGTWTETYTDGRRIVKQWRNNVRHGTWTEIHPDGRRIIERWRGGRRISRLEEYP